MSWLVQRINSAIFPPPSVTSTAAGPCGAPSDLRDPAKILGVDLLVLILRFLDRDSLVCATAVSRTWHTCFLVPTDALTPRITIPTLAVCKPELAAVEGPFTEPNGAQIARTLAAADQWRVWIRDVFKDGRGSSLTPKQTEIISEACYSGIPMCIRYRAWPVISGAYSSAGYTSSFYQNLDVAQCPAEQRHYLDLDGPRLVYDDEQGMEIWKSILSHYIVANPAEGYSCCGPGPITAFLLQFLEEEPCFWVLTELKHGPKFSSADGLCTDKDRLGQSAELISFIISSLDKALYNRLEESGFHFSLVASWIATLGTRTLARRCCARFFDCLLLFGLDFFYTAAFAVFQIKRDEVFACTTWETIVTIFMRNPVVTDSQQDEFMAMCKKHRGAVQKIVQSRKH
ncbi:hypothetical protein Pelo_5308 [Pelomyxa schiedti]|nr:hypothetical protein Pelo_5308 [Pelomyxa schiedti]